MNPSECDDPRLVPDLVDVQHALADLDVEIIRLAEFVDELLGLDPEGANPGRLLALARLSEGLELLRHRGRELVTPELAREFEEARAALRVTPGPAGAPADPVF